MSNNSIAIQIKDIHKEFILPQSKHTSFKQAAVNIVRKNNKVTQKALDGISFNINKGEFFGIIGRNGSGKSTMLKLLAGVYTPTSGEIILNGGLTPFIELGVGFNPELSGRDNIYLNGALLGFTRKQVDEMYEEIVDFAELEQFMDQKLKNYSSGMQVRLAFSIAIKAKNDILLFDEVLAVGDENFQKKCIEVFEELKRSGSTIIFVSHSMGQVRQFCDRVAVISDGKLLFIGDTEKGIDTYHKLNNELETALTRADIQKSDSLGTGGAKISEYALYDAEGKKTTSLRTGEKFTLKMKIDIQTDVVNPVVGAMFRKNPQENLYGINNYYEDIVIPPKTKGDVLEIKFEDTMPLNPGTYFLTLAITDAKSSIDYVDLHLLNNDLRVQVYANNEKWGMVRNNAKISW